MAVVSISRQFGAGGRTLGKMLADRLGYEFLDETTLDTLANKAHVWLEESDLSQDPISKRLIDILPEIRINNYLERFLSKESQTSLEKASHFEDLARVVQQLAEIDNLVLLGRGSQFILEHDPHVLKVLLVADQGSRVAFLTSHYRLAPEQAQRLIAQADKDRAKIMARFRPGESHESTSYHVVLNTSLVSLETAQELLLKAVRALEAKY